MIDAFVLAGGRSSRMGVDKARLPTPQGLPWAVHVAEVAAQQCERVALVRRDPDDGLLWRYSGGGDLEVVLEPASAPRHPLMGLVSACLAARTPFVLVVPCDLVALTPQEVAALIDAMTVGAMVDAATPLADARGAVVSQQPLFGIFPRAIAPLALAAAQRGERVRDFVGAATRVTLNEAALRNANTWEQTGWPRPLAALRARGVSERALAAERHRLAARGCLLPSD